MTENGTRTMVLPRHGAVTSSRATIVLPTSTASLRVTPLRTTRPNDRPLENATAPDTVRLFQAKPTVAATASATQPTTVSAARTGRPSVTSQAASWAAVAPVAIDAALNTTLTGSRRATACTTPTASGATTVSHGHGTRNRPRMIAASDQVKV